MRQKQKIINRVDFDLLHFIMLALVGVASFLVVSEAAWAVNSGSQTDSYKGFGYPWEHNSLGLTDEVPLPWTEIQVVDNTLKCWGREYLMSNGMLPRQITSQGQEIFQRPPAVNLKINRENALRESGKAIFSVKAGNRIEYKTIWEEKGYRVDAVSSLEYDGFFKVDLKIFPKTSISVDELVLSFPFQKKAALSFSRYIAYAYESQRFERADVVQSIGRTDRPVSFKFNPAVWIGNHDVGLEWICETNFGWSNSDPSSVIQITPGVDSVVLRVNVISKATNLSAPFALSFALYPTPIKKLPDDWRKYLVLRAKEKSEGLSPEQYSMFGIGFGFPTKYPGLPVMEPSESTELKSRGERPQEQISNTLTHMHSEGVKFIPYGSLYGMPAHLPMDEWKDYALLWKTMHPRGDIRNPHWAKLQNLTGKEPSLIAICPYHRSFQDFFVWQHVQAIEKYQVAGLYLDLSTPNFLCQNTNHPHGKFVAQGGEYYPFFTQRELMKRLFVACKSRNRNFLITQHQTKNLVICSGFSDLVLSGEALNRFFMKSHLLSKTFKEDIFNEDTSAYVPDYSELSEEFFEFQYSQNKGYVHMLLSQVAKFNEKLMRKNPELLAKYSATLFARAVVYGIPLYFERIDKERYRAILQAEQRAGVLGGASYLGPWESERFLAAGSGKLKASCYRLKGGKGIMLVLANLSDGGVQETLTLNLEGLKQAGVTLPRTFQVTDGVTGKLFPADLGLLTVALQPNGFQMLIIQ